MKMTNAWYSHNKNRHRIEIQMRFGSVTVFEFYADLKAKNGWIGVFNFFLNW